MCIAFQKEPKLERAIEDIRVLKYTYQTKIQKFLFIKRTITKGQFYDKTYKIGRIYREHLEKPKDYTGTGVFISSTGLYSYSTFIDPEDFIDNKYIFRAIIPKGSKYYYDQSRGVYISNKLKLVMTDL